MRDWHHGADARHAPQETWQGMDGLDGLDGHPHRISLVHAQGGHIGLPHGGALQSALRHGGVVRPRGDPVSIDRIDRESPGSLLTSGSHRIETFGSITGFHNKKKG